jgi:hypothetical protein
MNTIKTLLFLAIFSVSTLFGQSLVKINAGILISSGEKLLKLKSNAVLKSEDMYRILLQPDSAGYGYSIMINGTSAKLLSNNKVAKNQIHVYPTKGDYEKFSKKGEYELILFYSVNKITELDNLFKKQKEIKSDAFYKTFNVIKKKIKESVNDDSQININIAGNVKGTQDIIDEDFLNKLKPFVTKDILILQYKIKVQ